MERTVNTDSEDHVDLLRRIELYLRRHKLTPTRFGREVMGDPHFVKNLRSGRKMREKTVELVAAWLDSRDRAR